MFEQGWAAEFFLDVCDFSKVKSFYDQMSGFDFCSFWKEGGETSTEKIIMDGSGIRKCPIHHSLLDCQ